MSIDRAKCVGLALMMALTCGARAGAELIAPSRGLSEDSHSQAELWVFSEPPGLNVRVDASAVGTTPIILKIVPVGVHSVQVGESETNVMIAPGKATQVVLFKGEFIRVLVSDRIPRRLGATQPQPDLRQGTRPAPTASDRKEAETRHGLSDWELFMNRTLPFF